MTDYTLLMGFDAEHHAEHKVSAETLIKNCPQLTEVPWVVAADSDVYEKLSWVNGLSKVQIVEVNSPKEWPQRERMLAALTLQAPQYIRTKYLLKLDTDAICTSPQVGFPRNEWFEGDPVYVASGWSYSKPADAIQRLDDWADTVPELASYPRLNIPFDPASSRVAHKRCISWLYFGRTDWHQWAARILGERLPVPSHDTCLHFLAERTKQFYRHVRFSKLGWHHIGRGGKRLEQAVKEVLGG